MRLAIFLALTACGRASDGQPTSDATTSDSQATSDGAPSHDAPAMMADAAVTNPDAPAFPSKLDLEINCRNDCVLIANPASIAVPKGTEFTVNWINTGDTDCDVAKIDQFNQVPIIIGLEPGTSYHSEVVRLVHGHVQLPRQHLHDPLVHSGRLRSLKSCQATSVTTARASSTISPKPVCRSSAVVCSPVTRLSLTVRIESARAARRAASV